MIPMLINAAHHGRGLVDTRNFSQSEYFYSCWNTRYRNIHHNIFQFYPKLIHHQISFLKITQFKLVFSYISIYINLFLFSDFNLLTSKR